MLHTSMYFAYAVKLQAMYMLILDITSNIDKYKGLPAIYMFYLYYQWDICM